MFTCKALLLAVFLVGMGSPFSVAEDTQAVKVAPMSESDRKLKKCELHNCEVHVEDVQIAYAHPEEGYYEAMKRSFPHANTYAQGSCVYNEGDPTMQTVKYCLRCREAEKQWYEARRRK